MMKIRMTIYKNGEQVDSKDFKIPAFALPRLQARVDKMIAEKPDVTVTLERL